MYICMITRQQLTGFWHHKHSVFLLCFPSDPDEPPRDLNVMPSSNSLRISWGAPAVLSGPTSYLVRVSSSSFGFTWTQYDTDNQHCCVDPTVIVHMRVLNLSTNSHVTPGGWSWLELLNGQRSGRVDDCRCDQLDCFHSLLGDCHRVHWSVGARCQQWKIHRAYWISNNGGGYVEISGAPSSCPPVNTPRYLFSHHLYSVPRAQRPSQECDSISYPRGGEPCEGDFYPSRRAQWTNNCLLCVHLRKRPTGPEHQP